jgi:23S rRNA (guanosine2251-2'-O)-methyltransferase
MNKRDKLLTIYGRKPVLEALESGDYVLEKLWLADNARGEIIDRIVGAAKRVNVVIERSSAQKVSQISRNGKQDQGVALDILPPYFDSAEHYFETTKIENIPSMFVAFDRLTTPANLGMCIRAGVAAGAEGFILPRIGVSNLNPLVIKASAGTVFKARILHCERAEHGIVVAKNSGFTIIGLNSRANSNIFQAEMPRHVVWVLGGESEGYSPHVRRLTDCEFSIPMRGNLESMNVAAAGAVAMFEFYRRYLMD